MPLFILTGISIHPDEFIPLHSRADDAVLYCSMRYYPGYSVLTGNGILVVHSLKWYITHHTHLLIPVKFVHHYSSGSLQYCSDIVDTCIADVIYYWLIVNGGKHPAASSGAWRDNQCGWWWWRDAMMWREVVVLTWSSILLMAIQWYSMWRRRYSELTPSTCGSLFGVAGQAYRRSQYSG